MGGLDVTAQGCVGGAQGQSNVKAHVSGDGKPSRRQLEEKKRDGLNAWAAGEACGRRGCLTYGLEDRKGFVSESEEGVSEWGGSAQSWLCARPPRQMPSAMWSGGRGGCLPEKESQDREVIRFVTPGRH